VKTRTDNRMRKLVAVVALSFAMIAFFIPRDVRVAPLVVALGVRPSSETLIVARERGLLPDERVRLIDMTWPSTAMRAFGNQVVDAAILSLDEVLRLREPGRGVRVVMAVDVSEGAEAVVGSERAGSLVELRGKRVGVDQRSSGMLVLESALASVGVQTTEVNLVPLSPSESEAAMLDNQVDAVVLAEPWLTYIQRSDAKVLYDSSQLKMPLYRVLVVSEQAFQEKQAELRLLIDAHFALERELRSPGIPGAWHVASRREGLSMAEFQQSLGRVKMISREDNARLLKADGDLSRLSTELEMFMLERGLLKAMPAPTSWLDSSLLEDAP
jgi:NitT/TauT family transport system substrate-binding protein